MKITSRITALESRAARQRRQWVAEMSDEEAEAAYNELMHERDPEDLQDPHPWAGLSESEVQRRYHELVNSR